MCQVPNRGAGLELKTIALQSHLESLENIGLLLLSLVNGLETGNKPSLRNLRKARYNLLFPRRCANALLPLKTVYFLGFQTAFLSKG